MISKATRTAGALLLAALMGCAHQPPGPTSTVGAVDYPVPSPSPEEYILTPQHREPAQAFTDEEGNSVGGNASEEDAELNRVPFHQVNRFRGSPADYDPGPPPGTRWAELFARVPNYRALGMAMMNSRSEKFRWHFGPMFYRGRLGQNQVKVFVVGQEGAQDESLSNRGFTGGTGAKMMGFLNGLGITQSYLFMNTFVYTIHGQYEEPELKNIAQNPMSPIVIHRHELYNYMLEMNRGSLNVVVAVGSAAKDTVRTWIRSRGGRCDYVDETGKRCDGSVLGPGIQVIGVKHPGAAGKDPNAAAGLTRNFRTAFETVATAKQKMGARWLPPDPGARLNPGYRFSSAPVPFMDFSYSTTWRLGRGGTSSNRGDGQRSIQLFSAAGVYNDRSSSYQKPVDLMKGIPGFPAGEVEWEFVKSRPQEFDPGPADRGLAELLMGVARGFEFPDFARLGVTMHPSFGFMGPYRGRLNQAQAVVLADQESVDDLFSTRAMTGEGGQRFQAFLKSIGLATQYAIVRVLPVDVSDLDLRRQTEIAMNPQMLKNRQAVLDRIIQLSGSRMIVTVGPVSSQVVSALRVNLPVFRLAAHTDPSFGRQWSETQRQILAEAPKAGYRPEITPSAFNPQEILPIPRFDLPIHTKWWVGTSGSRAVRGYNKQAKRLDGNYYKFYMPDWAARLGPKPLGQAEAGLIDRVKKSPVNEASERD